MNSEDCDRLERLLGSLSREEIKPFNSPLQIEGESQSTAIGMPVIPEYMSASEFLSRASQPEEYIAPTSELVGAMEVSVDQPNHIASKPIATPFAGEDIQTNNEDFSPGFPSSDIDLQITDRFDSDDYWRKFITNTTTHES